MITILIIISGISAYCVFRMANCTSQKIDIDAKANSFADSTICRIEMSETYNEIISEINNSNNHLNN